jgi:hypothetical protein
MLLSDGQQWMYSKESTLTEALCVARSLRGDLPLYPRSPVWIGKPVTTGVKGSKGE